MKRHRPIALIAVLAAACGAPEPPAPTAERDAAPAAESAVTPAAESWATPAAHVKTLTAPIMT